MCTAMVYYILLDEQIRKVHFNCENVDSQI